SPRPARLRHRLPDRAGDCGQHRRGADRLPQPGDDGTAAARRRSPGDHAAMTFALIPAAGKSTRMGRSKLALALGEQTVLEHFIAALRSGGAEHVLVVLGPHVSELTPLAESAGASVLVLPEETADMRATVEAGLRWLEERFAPRPENAWLLA